MKTFPLTLVYTHWQLICFHRQTKAMRCGCCCSSSSSCALCGCVSARERGQRERESERLSIAIWLALPVKFVCHCSQQFNFNSCAATRVTLKVGGAGQAGGAAGRGVNELIGLICSCSSSKGHNLFGCQQELCVRWLVPWTVLPSLPRPPSHQTALVD